MSASDDCLLESEVRKTNWLRSRDLGLRLREFWDDFEGKNGVLSRFSRVAAQRKWQKSPPNEFCPEKPTKGKSTDKIQKDPALARS
jgi:hypothetical protein